MSTDFYNKVAKKFGNYHTDANYTREYPNGDPEAVFREELIKLSGQNKDALDVGCADGRFSLSISPNFHRLTAIDLSTGMLAAAKRNQEEQAINKVSFEEQDAGKTNFADSAFDLIYSRRGPTPFAEFHRLLKPGGYFIGIDIGEKDCREIKQAFGRGQNFGKWNNSELTTTQRELTKNGFEVVFARDFLYDEFYASYNDLDLFLQGVPIFEDFDSQKDKKYLEKYTSQFTTKKGIRLPRHRVVIIARKP